MTSLRISMWKKCRKLKNEKLISLVETAKKLNYCPNNVRKLINKHQIRAYKIGGQWYLAEQQVLSLERFLRDLSP